MSEAVDDMFTASIVAVVVVVQLTLPVAITVVFPKFESMHTVLELALVPAIEIEKELLIPNSKSITVANSTAHSRSVK